MSDENNQSDAVIRNRLKVAASMVSDIPEELRSAAFTYVLGALDLQDRDVSEGGAVDRVVEVRRSSEPEAHDEPNRKRTTRSNSGSNGSTATFLSGLIDSGFFAGPRSVNEVITRVKDQHGRNVPSGDMSKALLRLLRAKKLVRSKNELGVYQYAATSFSSGSDHAIVTDNVPESP